MITKEFAAAFGTNWVAAWNAHDLERVLSFYSEDFSIESPMAVLLYPQSGGLVTGKNEVRKYWTIGLQKNPALQFELLDIFIGVNSVGLLLLNTTSDKKSVELLQFDRALKVHQTIVVFSE